MRSYCLQSWLGCFLHRTNFALQKPQPTAQPGGGQQQRFKQKLGTKHLACSLKTRRQHGVDVSFQDHKLVLLRFINTAMALKLDIPSCTSLVCFQVPPRLGKAFPPQLQGLVSTLEIGCPFSNSAFPDKGHLRKHFHMPGVQHTNPLVCQRFWH